MTFHFPRFTFFPFQLFHESRITHDVFAFMARNPLIEQLFALTKRPLSALLRTSVRSCFLGANVAQR